MVQLISKDKIENANIDTVERAIVFAATILRAALVNGDGSNNQATEVRIAQIIGNEGNFIFIESSFNYNPYLANLYGGNIIIFLEEFETMIGAIDEVKYTLEPYPNPTGELPDYNTAIINSFEKYFVYYCFILQASLGGKNDFIEIKQLEESKQGATIKIKIKLPFDYSGWLAGNNYVSTVNNLQLDSYLNLFENLSYTDYKYLSEITNILTNSQLLTNNQLLTN